MKRYLAGLSRATTQAEEGLPDGVFLARVERLQYLAQTQATLRRALLRS